MDNNRLTRFTVAGWAFVLSCPLQAWIFGVDFNLVISSLPNTQSLAAAVAAVIVALTAGPILGFVMNTFAYGIICLYRGGDPEFDVPKPDKDFSQFISVLQKQFPLPETKTDINKIVLSIQNTSSYNWWQFWIRRKHKKNIDNLIPYFNVQFHDKASSTLIEYATRRWTIYWMYANSICAIICGTILAFITSGNTLNREFVFDTKIYIEISLVTFIAFGIWSMIRIPKQIFSVAFMWLYSANDQTNSK